MDPTSSKEALNDYYQDPYRQWLVESVIAPNSSSYLKQPEVQKECKSVVKIDKVGNPSILHASVIKTYYVILG